MARNKQVQFAKTWPLMLAGMSMVAIAALGSNPQLVQAQTPEVKTPAATPQPQKPEPQVGPPIFNTSSPSAIALAQHLNSIKARFFGAWWCKYCSAQKEVLGREAMTYIEYVECDLRGLNPRRDLCIASQVPAFPTWEINGNRVTGVQTLEQLADISGYAGDRKF